MSSARTIYHMRVKQIIDHTANVRELVLKTESPAEFKFKADQFVHAQRSPGGGQTDFTRLLHCLG